MDAWELRYRIYAHLAEFGTAPAPATLDGWTGAPEATARGLAELHERHAIVLDQDGAIRMALPFSAIPTDHRVVAGDRSWFANCAWDALAIPVLLGVDARIEAPWLDGDPVGLSVAGGQLSSTDGWVHYAVPAARWWDDIVET
ncbi:MAG: organomercurial lyase [Ilumatobacteraceae bacterium]